ncbi:pyrroline-5-carboxylate reductase family protein [Catenulispora subtropica]|uniref:Pyrroline-5-carboxylate reductase n=1 Tax=Catenulispora subtropica TaxID=450798 RepID=A0ABN2RWH8_9ACTN
MQRVVIVGAGRLGMVIGSGIKRGVPDVELHFVDATPEGRERARERLRAEAAAAYEPAPGDLTLLTLPPQAFPGFAAGQDPHAVAGVTVVSLMAGVRLGALTGGLRSRQVIRGMTNIAAQVGKAVTVLAPDPAVTTQGVALADKILAGVGSVVKVADEDALDAASAVVGGGTALVAYFADALAEFAMAAGFSSAQACTIALGLLTGTAELVERLNATPADVYKPVLTPGGTTAEGFALLQETRWQDMLRAALEKSAERSREIGGEVDGLLKN